MTMQLLKPKDRAVAQRFLYFPLPVFGCLSAALLRFKLLQPVAEPGAPARLLQSVTNLLRKVTAKNIS